ncbi:Protein of unknown function [Micrococcales bacterium KH10]|nr:Protein of unknown function [Micrococcales bacterium KH10]
MSAQSPKSTRKVGRGVVIVAIIGTVVIGLGAAVLSFTALADLAVRAGTPATLAFIWPIIVDGVILVATIAIVALRDSERSPRMYAWSLLIGAAFVSVIANGAHALVAVDAATPVWIAVVVASVPPIVLLAITHLTVILARRAVEPVSRRKPSSVRAAAAQPAAVQQPHVVPSDPEPVVPAIALHAVTSQRAEPVQDVGGDDAVKQWIREQVAAGVKVTGASAFRAGVFSSEATARRRLRELRDSEPGWFEPVTDGDRSTDQMIDQLVSA